MALYLIYIDPLHGSIQKILANQKAIEDAMSPLLKLRAVSDNFIKQTLSATEPFQKHLEQVLDAQKRATVRLDSLLNRSEAAARFDKELNASIASQKAIAERLGELHKRLFATEEMETFIKESSLAAQSIERRNSLPRIFATGRYEEMLQQTLKSSESLRAFGERVAVMASPDALASLGASTLKSVAQMGSVIDAMGLNNIAAATVASALATVDWDVANVEELYDVAERSGETLGEGVTSSESSANQHRQLVWESWLSKQPVAVQIIVGMLFALLLMPVWQKYLDHKWEQFVRSDQKPELQAQLLEEIHEVLGDRESPLRCVSTRGSGLNVRGEPDKDAPVVGRLAPGQAVEVVETRGAWSLVRYAERPSENLRQGWAASGYLRKVAC